MYTAVVVIQLIVSIVMIIAVLLQVGKGATMGSTFGGGSSSQTVFGSAGPATLLAKITWVCLVIFLISSVYLTHLSASAKKSSIMSSVPALTAPAKTPEQGAAATKAAVSPAALPSGPQSATPAGKSPATATPAGKAPEIPAASKQ
ncbi:MAG: preprotein translocase subunit SecG [Deltaproteobacteria bacterium]|nr:preprotein translocase subunit SecG [Deltaproteobacteria bacterium]